MALSEEQIERMRAELARNETAGNESAGGLSEEQIERMRDELARNETAGNESAGGLSEEQIERMRDELARNETAGNESAGSLSKEQIERMRADLAGEQPVSTPSPKVPSVLSTGIKTVFKFIKSMFVWMGVATIAFALFLGGMFVINKLTEPPPPEIESITYQEPIQEVWKDAHTWCKQTERVNEALIYHTKAEETYRCSKLVRNVKVLNGIHFEWQFMTFDEKVEFRRPYFEEGSVPKILGRLSEFKPAINCNIDLEAMPRYKDRSLWKQDLKKIRNWYKQEEQRLHLCIKGSIWGGETAASKFLTNLFVEVMQPVSDDVLEQFQVSFSTNNKIEEAYQSLLDTWRSAQTKKYVENSEKWDRYAEEVIKPAAKRGGREERKYDRQIAKEEADKAFRDKHGMNPDDDCIFKDERGRVKFRGKCRDYVKQEGRLMNATSGWGAMWEEIGEVASEMERKRVERQRLEQQAYNNLILLQSEARKNSVSAPGKDPGPMGHAKKGPEMEPGCKVPHNIGKFSGGECLFLTKCTPIAPLKTCVKRNWQKEEACHARKKAEGRVRSEEQYSALKAAGSACEQRAKGIRDRLDGRYKGHSGSGKGKSK